MEGWIGGEQRTLWLEIALVVSAISLSAVYLIDRSKEGDKRRLDTIAELRTNAHSAIESAHHSLLNRHHKDLISSHAECEYAKLLEVLPDYVRKEAPSLKKGDDSLGNALAVRIFLLYDPCWRDLLG